MAQDKFAVLNKLPLKPVAEVLKVLQEIRAREKNGEPVKSPLITIYLKSCPPVSGWILEIGQEMLLLHQSTDDRGGKCGDALYLNCPEIIGLTVHSALDYINQFSSAESSRTESAPLKIEKSEKPSHLQEKKEQTQPKEPEGSKDQQHNQLKAESKQKAQEFSETISRTFSSTIHFIPELDSIPANTKAFQDLNELMNRTSGILTGLSQDTLSRIEVSRRLRIVVFSPGLGQSVEFRDGTLAIRVSFDAAEIFPMDKLRIEIETMF
ncbi:MAG: hypothetical protein PHW04_16910 [Candidatus Wallbacteria bacterium]|nr:hypothetical protein [Candidatus Wallbacteria bacterium]